MLTDLSDSHVVGVVQDYHQFMDVDFSSYNIIPEISNAGFKFLWSFYLFDDFGKDHGSRREWQSSFGSEYYDLFKTNCLSYNVGIVTAHLLSTMLPDFYIGENSEKLSDICNEIQEVTRRVYSEVYNAFSDSYKFNFLHNLKKMVYYMINIDNPKIDEKVMLLD